MEPIRLMPTKVGNGFKLVVNGEWYYISDTKLSAMLNNEQDSCTFTAHKDFKTDAVEGNLKELVETITSEILKKLPTKKET